MNLLIVFFTLLYPFTSNCIQWLALSRLSSIASVNPMTMCEKMKGSLIRKQIKFCKKNPNFMDSVRLGAARAVDECQHQFQSRRWNCSTLENRVEEKMSLFSQKLGGGDPFQNMKYGENGRPPSSLEGYLPRPASTNVSLSRMDFELAANSRLFRNKRGGRRLLQKIHNRTNETANVADSNKSDDYSSSRPSDPKETLQKHHLNNNNNNNGKKAKRNKSSKAIKKALKSAKHALGPYPVVSPGTREMAFVHAISSAGVAHALTRACSSGDLENCGCDRSLRGMSPKGFQWSGCSDNVDFGITFSRTFVDARDRRKSRKKPTRAQPLMNLHNNEAGRKLLERNMKIECKCHGVSGSCELKTCWRSIASFRIIGEILKEKFDNAHEVTQKKRRGRRMLLPRYHKFKPHTDTDLVYLKNSPDYCDFDMQKGSLGTHGRECNPNSDSVNGCNFLCCNRGFVTRKEKRVERCKCKFHWCCYVECEECYREVRVSTCN